MMIRAGQFRSGFVIAALALAVLAFANGQASAACRTTGPNRVQITAGTAVAVTPAYDPYATGDRLHAFSVTVNNPSRTQTCSFALSFTRAALPARMSSGAFTLQYSVESLGGATLLQTTGFVFGSSPAAANRLAGFVGTRSSVTLSVRIRIPAGQTNVAAGTYTDNSVTIGVYEISGTSPIASVDTKAFSVSTNISPACQLPAPDFTTLDFTSAITAGAVNAAVIRRATFLGAACTQPSKIRLSGIALQPLVPAGAVAGFDSFIDYRAVGVFGAASATLTTKTGSAATSTGYNIASGPVTGATITIDVNLVAGNPILAGSYSTVLTVSIDPAL